MIFHILFHLDSALTSLAVKLSGGAIFGLGYLYVAYKIGAPQQEELKGMENFRKMKFFTKNTWRKSKSLPALSALSCGATISMMLYFVSGSSIVSALLPLLMCGVVAATYYIFN